jgi:Transposase DDE domain group 1
MEASRHRRCWSFSTASRGLEYVVNMAANAVLKRFVKSALRVARRRSKQSGKTEHVYGECLYAAKKWPHRRRVIFKAEVVRLVEREPRENPRFVITNLRQNPRWIYQQVYCQRGEIENRIKGAPEKPARSRWWKSTALKE